MSDNLDTLTEISRILYATPEERCPRSILRLHNQTFLHATMPLHVKKSLGSLRFSQRKSFMGDTYTLSLYMLLSNIVLSAAGQPILKNKTVTSIHFQASLHQHQVEDLGRVSRKSRNFKGLFFGCHNSLFISKTERIEVVKLHSYFSFCDLEIMLKDRLSTTSG